MTPIESISIRGSNRSKMISKLVAIGSLLLVSAPTTVMGRIPSGTSSTSHRRADVIIKQASDEYKASSESLYDHMMTLEEGLVFHWNDPGEDGVGANVFSGRIVHVSETAEKAASYLALGVSNVEFPTSESELMIGSDAIIGVVSTSDVAKYYLGSRMPGENGIRKMEDEKQTLIDSKIQTHVGDDGSVTTILSFEKNLKEDDSKEIVIKKDARNTFLFAVGLQSNGDGLSYHGSRGAFQLDFDEIVYLAEKGQIGSDIVIFKDPEPVAEEGQIGSDTVIIEDEQPVAVTNTRSEAEIDTEANTETDAIPETETDSETDTESNSETDTESNNKEYDSAALDACASDDPDYLHMVKINSKTKFHWNLDVWSNDTPPAVNGKLVFEGQAWLGFGFSFDGSMIGSEAIIGIPDHEDFDRPLKFKLGAKNVGEITPLPDAQQTLLNAEITQKNRITTLTFKKLLSEDNTDELEISADGMNNFIYAVGTSNTFGYHQFRGSFKLDLSSCNSPIASSRHLPHKSKAAWVAHGVVATLAWAVAIPAAVTTAWFRTIVPQTWIYIHVFCNVAGFFLTLIAFIIAVTTMSLSNEPAHFSDPHHIVGLVLMLFVTFQVMNGFFRPPVEQKKIDYGWIPHTARGAWHLLHRVMGVVLLLLAFWQIQNGLLLFADHFGYRPMTNFFFAYIIVLAIACAGLKVWLIAEQDRAHLQAASINSSINIDKGIGPQAVHKVAFTNGIDPDSELAPVQFDLQ
mmetsp:Transcript_6064/g.7906  ORF Transcript_6064/g.7906 Transcript_6064/m.7906 type:complete len:744 (-) Transcript_6064:287-2518(-)